MRSWFQIPLRAALVFAASLCWADQADLTGKIPPSIYHRTAFLGDSITDGNTYPQLVRDGLKDAGLPAMVEINAGIGGDTAAGMRGRLERDVLAFHPTLVTLSAGANDAMHGVLPPAYERDVRAIVDRLKAEHVPLIILTPNVVGPSKQAKAQSSLDAYEVILRRIAKEYGLRVAEVNQRQKQNAAAGHVQLAPDEVHPNWEGQSMIARAVLDAMGYGDVKVPDHISNVPLPGVIGEWKLKRMEDKSPALTEAAVIAVKPDESWLTVKVPETQAIPDLDSNSHWLDDYRTLGACVSLRQQPKGQYIGVASVPSSTSRSVQFHTGAELDQVWVNGKLVYQNEWNRGYHIGRESVAGTLRAGENTIVIKTGPVFFLSITEGPMWEEK